MIHFTRRTVLGMLGVTMISPLAGAWGFGPGKLEVTLSIADEQGAPIPHVTVWGYVLPRNSELAIDGDDLWRLATRYQSSFEFALPILGNVPVPLLEVYPMGDGRGDARLVIDYGELEGSDSRRRASMQIGFAVMKRGYLPARVDFAVRNERRLSGKVVLERDPEHPVETQPYLLEFERIRYELSDPSRNTDMALKSHERIDGLHKALHLAAEQAMVAGDKAAAARIYARMQYLPSILVSNGDAVGFVQAEPDSDQSSSYLETAYRLDPGNPHIAAEYLFMSGANEFGGNKYRRSAASEERQIAFAHFLSRLHVLMRESGVEVWPVFHGLYARWHRKSSNPDERAKMMPLLEALYQFEPKFDTKDQLLRVSAEMLKG